MDYQTNGNGYGKRPLWQWIVLYVIIGGIVYGFIYYFFLRGSGGRYNYNSNPSYNAPENQQPAPITNKAPSIPIIKSFTVNANDTSADLTTITVSKGTLVRITFSVDAEGTYHGGLDFRSSVVSTGPISPGSSKTISFTATNSFAFTPYWPLTNVQKPYTINVVVQ